MTNMPVGKVEEEEGEDTEATEMESPHPTTQETTQEETPEETMEESARDTGNASPGGEVVYGPSEKPKENLFTWRVEAFSSLSERKVYGETFEFGGSQWRLLLFPKGSDSALDAFASLFLDCVSTVPSQFIRFELRAVNQLEDPKSVVHESTHRFTSIESDWGFKNFISLKLLTDTKEGFLVDDTLVLEVRMWTVSSDWYGYSYWNYDSKKETGFVGLKNQGATCYMNSLLQTLFHINEFTRAVYKMPIDPDKQVSIPVAMQRVFYKLQFSSSSVSTKDLTKSFGWDAYDAFTQHDVQELTRVLCDNLEGKMKDTEVDGTISRLFCLTLGNFIRCINVNYESRRDEVVYDIQLVVKGCKDIYESLNQYCETETLEGENQYEAEGFGKQDATKGVQFKVLPPVLVCHLRRFEYDPYRDVTQKVNDSFQFYEEIDLQRDEYVAPDADRSIPWVYELHSVLVHSGEVHGGHYYAFIRPTTGDQWYKFDDERVTKATRENAIDDNFGGPADADDRYTGYYSYYRRYGKKFSNAYMLVYVRKFQAPEILRPIEEEEIPEDVRARLEREAEEDERKRKERSEAHLYINVKVAHTDDLKKHKRVGDLCSFEDVEVYKVRRSDSLDGLQNEIAEKYGIPPEEQRFWTWIHRQNKTLRPEVPLRDMEMRTPIDMHHSAYGDWKLLLERVNPKTPEWDCDTDVMLFFKYFEPCTKTIEYIGQHGFKKADTIDDLYHALRQMMELPETLQLSAYEEVKATRVDSLDDEFSTLAQNELISGDIIVFQTTPTLQDLREDPLATIDKFYDYTVNRITVNFREIDKPRDPLFSLELSKKMPYDEVAERVAEKLEQDKNYLRFTGYNSYTEGPKTTPIRGTGLTLVDMLTTYHQLSDILFFEKLEYSILELETKKVLKIHWYNCSANFVKVLTVLAPQDGTVSDLQAMLKEMVSIEGTGIIRLMNTWSHKIISCFKPTDSLSVCTDLYVIRGVPEEELPENRPTDSKVIQVSHTCKDAYSYSMTHNFGVPFFLLIGPDEKLSSVKSRVQKKLSVEDEEFAKWKWAAIQYGRTLDLDDDDVVARYVTQHSDYLAMEHADTSPKEKSSYRYVEKSIKIYN